MGKYAVALSGKNLGVKNLGNWESIVYNCIVHSGVVAKSRIYT